MSHYVSPINGNVTLSAESFVLVEAASSKQCFDACTDDVNCVAAVFDKESSTCGHLNIVINDRVRYWLGGQYNTFVYQITDFCIRRHVCREKSKHCNALMTCNDCEFMSKLCDKCNGVAYPMAMLVPRALCTADDTSVADLCGQL